MFTKIAIRKLAVRNVMKFTLLFAALNVVFAAQSVHAQNPAWKFDRLDAIRMRNMRDQLFTLNVKVLAYARAHLGQQVGPGQCSDLVIAALQSAGAKTTYDYGVSGYDADYVWGTQVSLAAAQPGDCIQFRNVKTYTTTASGWFTRTYDHHSAIISKVLGGGKFMVYEQNAAGVMRVQENPLNLNDKIAGTYWIYHPVAK